MVPICESFLFQIVSITERIGRIVAEALNKYSELFSELEVEFLCCCQVLSFDKETKYDPVADNSVFHLKKKKLLTPNRLLEYLMKI